MVGIISQGLRIAPPEAPHNGYMFGKGVRAVGLFFGSHLYYPEWDLIALIMQLYFADAVSKSANYCWTSQSQPKVHMLIHYVMAIPNAKDLVVLVCLGRAAPGGSCAWTYVPDARL